MTFQNYDYFCSVKGLLIPKHANRKKIAEGVEEFIITIPELSEKLKENLFAGKIPVFIRNMETVLELLQTVNARYLATDAEYLLKEAKGNNTELCRKQIAPFVTELLSLSVDMQMAQNNAAHEAVEAQGKIEMYTDIVNNLTAIESLIADGEHSEACAMISDMKALENEPIAEELIKAISNQKHEKIGKMVKALKDYYIKLIVIYGGSENLNRKILAVDDRPETLSSVNYALRGRYKVLCAPSGKVALKILESEKPELFILDVEMPVMNGYQLAIMLRCTEEHAKTPILFLTSNATRDCVLKAMAAGADNIIVKPANNNTLLAKVSKYLP